MTILLRVLGVVIFFVVLLLAFGRLFGPVELVIWAALLVAAVVFTIRWSRRHRPTVAR